MIGLAGAIVLAGYQLMTFGWSQLQGDNAGFFDILWPGRFKGLSPDGATGGSTADTVTGANGFVANKAPGAGVVTPPSQAGRNQGR